MSFVADWFANIGDLIYANIPRPNVSAMGGSWFVVDRKTVVVAPKQLTYTDSGYALQGSLGDYYREVVTSKVRHPKIEISDSGLVIKSDFRFDNWNRCADAAALLKQSLHRLIF
jgi:hypothetical protein